jgi:hypothetical protein
LEEYRSRFEKFKRNPLLKITKNLVKGGGKDQEQLLCRLKPRKVKENVKKIGG